MTYKDKEWCRVQFLNFLEEDISPEDREDVESLTLAELIKVYEDRWFDFAVLEGLDKKDYA